LYDLMAEIQADAESSDGFTEEFLVSKSKCRRNFEIAMVKSFRNFLVSNHTRTLGIMLANHRMYYTIG
jgi:hypothetical protein